MRFTVFVSHSMKRGDKNFIKSIKDQGLLAGCSLYFAEDDHQPGVRLDSKIENAIRSSDAFLALVTKHGALSAYVQQEIGFARACDKPRFLVVEKGVSAEGFELGAEHVEFDRKNPQRAFAIIGSRLARLKADNDLTTLLLVVLLILGAFILLCCSKSR